MTRPVVGLDPSLTGTGVATMDGQWTILTKPASNLTGQLTRLRSIVAAVYERTPALSLVVIEAPAFSRANAGTHRGAGLWWMFADVLDARGCQLVEVAPTAVKKFATGKGSASKADMRMALYQRAGLDIADDDQVDAWWLRQMGLHLVGDPSAIDLPKTQLAVLAGVRGQLPSAS